jgi:hypothetical protein
MRICRTIFALVIALSVATLPAAGGIATIATAADAPMSEHMSSEDTLSETVLSESMAQPMADCEHRAMPCHKGMDDCQSMAACALKCFNFTATSFSVLSYPTVPKDSEPVLADSGFHPQTSSPPFRPPRI